MVCVQQDFMEHPKVLEGTPSTAPVPPDDWAERLAPGMIVAERYALVRLLGQGTTGSVWEATHRILTKSVAIKFLSDSARQRSELMLERFRYEAQVSARLAEATHHIVAVHDAALFEGVPYIVMDLALGESLERRLEREALTLDEVAVVVRQIGKALQASHAAGIVHRDVKPGNIMSITRGSSAEPLFKLTDFGVAKNFGDRLTGALQPRATTAGLLVGSPAYMSPEQVAGSQHLDGSADVWALAVVIYESLSQRLPFDGSEITELALRIVQGRCEPIRELAPGLPRGLDAFFAKAFAAERVNRYTTIEALLEGFELAIVGTSASVPPVRPISMAPPSVATPLPVGRPSGDAFVPPPPIFEDEDDLPRRRSNWAIGAVILCAISLIALVALLVIPPTGQDGSSANVSDRSAKPDVTVDPKAAAIPESFPTSSARTEQSPTVAPILTGTPAPTATSTASASASPSTAPADPTPGGKRRLNPSEVY